MLARKYGCMLLIFQDGSDFKCSVFMSPIMFILCLLIYSSENVYSIYEPKELLELKRCKSKLQIEHSVEEGRLNSHVYSPSLPSPR